MTIEFSRLKKSFCVIALVAMSVSVAGCSLVKNQMQHDRAANKELKDYKVSLDPRPMPKAGPEEIPNFYPVVATPASLKLPSPLVTVSVNRTVSLRDIMFELTEQAGVDIEMDPQITGSLIFSAKDRPFNEVVERICKMTGLRYKFADNILRIEHDRPYVKHYKVDYMGVSRSSSSSISNSVSVTGGSDAEGSPTSSSGSSSSIDGDYESTFWDDLDVGLDQVLDASSQYISLATTGDPTSNVRAAPQPVPTEANPNPAPNMAPPTLSVSTRADTYVDNPDATYTINKEIGMVTVFANERQHRLVKAFLGNLRKNSMAQIQIQAKILEVSLSDSFATGIEWNNIDIFSAGKTSLDISGLNYSNPKLRALEEAAKSAGVASNVFTANISLADIVTPTIKALSSFGTVRALSSPRVTVMNGRPAVVNMTKNIVYFEIEKEETTTTDAGGNEEEITESTATIRTAAEGVLLNVLPNANVDTGEIILSLRPTVSTKTDEVVDPTNDGNIVPVMSIQEIDSIVRVQSGQTVVMGGIMRDNNVVSREGVPVLADVPLLGNLFSYKSDDITKSELVILLQATLIPGANADETDRHLYKEYGLDRHPISF